MHAAVAHVETSAASNAGVILNCADSKLEVQRGLGWVKARKTSSERFQSSSKRGQPEPPGNQFVPGSGFGSVGFFPFIARLTSASATRERTSETES